MSFQVLVNSYQSTQDHCFYGKVIVIIIKANFNYITFMANRNSIIANIKDCYYYLYG